HLPGRLAREPHLHRGRGARRGSREAATHGAARARRGGAGGARAGADSAGGGPPGGDGGPGRAGATAHRHPLRLRRGRGGGAVPRVPPRAAGLSRGAARGAAGTPRTRGHDRRAAPARVLDPPRHRAAALRLGRGRRVRVRSWGLRREGHPRRAARGGGATARRGAERPRPALRGRRRAGQCGRASGERPSRRPRVPLAHRRGADLHIRLVTDQAPVRELLERAVGSQARIEYLSFTPPVRLTAVPDFEQCVVGYTTDVPHLSNWGTPLLLGPGSIHDAHTARERIAKAELERGVELYLRLGRTLLAEAAPARRGKTAGARS